LECPSIRKEGKSCFGFLWRLLAIVIICWIVAGHLAFVLSLIFSTAFFLFIANFFRSPKRFVQADPRAILAPADGKVVVIERVFEPEYLKTECIQLSIFMSIFNVHANWFPIDGEVLYYSHNPGNYLAAYLPKSSVENEHSSVVIRSSYNGEKILVRQVAGALARRIVTYAYTGKRCHINEHLGFIKFGSRVDLFLPPDAVEILIKYKKRTVGNKTVIARWKATSPDQTCTSNECQADS
jgi:phosphatidylserine decarboxylase